MAGIHKIQEESQLPDNPKDLYIDLMKRVVANTIYEDKPLDHKDTNIAKDYHALGRQEGFDWPSVAHTMIGMKRLDNIHACMKQIIKKRIPGDFVETGVWRGGATILMRAILKAYDVRDRSVWVCDSFEGLPPVNTEKYPADALLADMNLHNISYLAVSLEQVQQNFAKYGLLDKQVIFLKGFFCDTLPTAPINKIALLRLDGDLYESTMDALVNLYPKLSKGGFVIVDDFWMPACSQAILDYRKMHGINDEIQQIDMQSVFWQKTY